MDLINAKTDKSLKLAINQVSGKVSNLIKDLRDKIVQIIANIEVNIDYPEYEDVLVITNEMIKENISIIEENIKEILKKSENSKIINEGISVAIIGRPNVGKSSLLNALLEESKAIVTEIEGTTRDFVEGTINLDGIMLNLIDTAGIRKTKDVVESIGINKSKELIDKASLILFLLNNNEEMNDEEKEIYELLKDKNYIIVVNKSDLEKKLIIEDDNKVLVSAKTGFGLEDLKNKIKEKYNLETIETDDLTYLSSARSISLLRQALESVNDVKKALELDTPIDLIEIDLKNIWEILGSIIGANYEDELIDQLFSRFCLGK